MAAEPAGLDPAAPPGQVAGPSRWWGHHVAELRWQAELARLVTDPVYRGQGVPRGHGEPVLLIPGFLAGDASLAVMQGWLRRIGYEACTAGITWNVDCSDRAVRRLDRRLADLHERTGHRVALIGHSRGAHFAKALAHRRPERVAGMISLGAGLDEPFDISVPTQAAVAAVRAFHHSTRRELARSRCMTTACDCAFTRDYVGSFPADVPLTSVYSREDGVVRWRSCLVPYGRNVEVTGSHVGLAFNRKAYRVVAEALAQMAPASASASAAA